MSVASTLLATAIASGGDKLSLRDCLICSAYASAGGNTAQNRITAAIAAGLDKLSYGDLWKCVAYAVAGGSMAQNRITTAIGQGFDALSDRDLMILQASKLWGNDQTTLGLAIAAGFGRLSPRDLLIVKLYGLGITGSTVEALMVAAGFTRLSIRDSKICAVANESWALILNTALGTFRNNFTGRVGFAFTVGSIPIVVTDLGRWIVAGNNQIHTISIYNATPTLVTSVAINTVGKTAGQYAYSAITPVTLAAAGVYYLESSEVNAGDQWYNFDTVLTATSDVILGPSCFNEGPAGAAGTAYVPPSLKYHL